MLIYYAVIAISCLCVYIGFKIKLTLFRQMFNVIAILVPSLLAGYRDTTVGMDLAYYAVPCFNAMCDTYSLKLLILYWGTGLDLEPLYIIYNFVITRYTDDIFWALFVQQLIVLGLVLFTCYKLKKYVSVPCLYSIFMLLCYLQSMSANRQIFAIAIVFYSFYYVIVGKKYIYICIILLATFFHYSAIIAMPIFWIYNYFKKNEIKKHHLIVTLLLGTICFLCFPVIIHSLIGLGLLAAKYIRYVDDSNKAHTINLVILVALSLVVSLSSNRKAQNNMLYFMFIIIFFMYLCGVYNDVATRVAWYYLLFAAILALKLSSQIPNKNILKNIVVALFTIQFVYLSIFTSFADAIPYTSTVLKIKGE